MTPNDSVRSLILGLSRVPGIGRHRLRRTVDALIGADSFSAEREPPPSCFAHIEQRLNLSEIRKQGRLLEEACGRHGVACYIYQSSGYPRSLLRLPSPPAVLFVKGPIDVVQHDRVVAVVGTRQPTAWGLECASAYAKAIVEAGGVVLSGLAAGIDSAAHTATIQATGLGCGIVAGGVAHAERQRLAKHLLDHGGALVSEYPPEERPNRHQFVERDRIQAGLSAVVIVVESRVGGGTMHAARMALQVRVPLWAATPPNFDSESAALLPLVQQGTALEIRAGRATPIADLDGLKAMLGAIGKEPPEHRPEQIQLL